MEIWKKGWQSGRERSGTEREGGVIFVVGATKGGTKAQSLTFNCRRSERRVCRSINAWKWLSDGSRVYNSDQY